MVKHFGKYISVVRQFLKRNERFAEFHLLRGFRRQSGKIFVAFLSVVFVEVQHVSLLPRFF